MRFLREIDYLKNNYPIERVKAKYQKVYDIYKSVTPKFFEQFEAEGFSPFTLSPDYTGSMNPFEIQAEKENELENSVFYNPKDISENHL